MRGSGYGRLYLQASAQGKLRAVLAKLQPETPSIIVTPTEKVAAEVSVLDTEPLEQLRELEDSGDFQISEFVELFQTSGGECLQRA